MGPGHSRRQDQLLGMAKKAPAPAAPPTAQEQIRAYVDGVFEYATKAAEQYRDQLIMNALKSLEVGMSATQADMLQKQEGHHVAVRQSIANAGTALTTPLQEMRQRMERERLDSPEALAKKFAPHVQALGETQRPKPVTLKEPEGKAEILELTEEVKKAVAPKPKATK